ncbi:hypothetical protein P389DRAFT_194625 [Cystobasidium minutum MCA 4210]|uniref:uncharacterized protein n=1 Tax=Cystobasidium minutum MCA 4210 TaxID=1397322 RepID=UPI0034D00FDB|eukprot:jgi/Rhomi1/194625/gm1.2839_g
MSGTVVPVAPAMSLIPAPYSFTINACAFVIHYTILLCLVGTRTFEKLPGSTLFVLLRTFTFICRYNYFSGDYHEVGDALTLLAYVPLLADIIVPLSSTISKQRRLRDQVVLLLCLGGAATSGCIVYGLGAFEGPHPAVQIYRLSVGCFLAAALCSTIFSTFSKDKALMVMVALLITLAAMPLLFLQITQTFPGTLPYMHTEAVLFSCWYLPEVALLGSLWYALHSHVWPCDNPDACGQCMEICEPGTDEGTVFEALAKIDKFSA